MGNWNSDAQHQPHLMNMMTCRCGDGQLPEEPCPQFICTYTYATIPHCTVFALLLIVITVEVWTESNHKPHSLEYVHTGKNHEDS